MSSSIHYSRSQPLSEGSERNCSDNNKQSLSISRYPFLCLVMSCWVSVYDEMSLERETPAKQQDKKAAQLRMKDFQANIIWHRELVCFRRQPVEFCSLFLGGERSLHERYFNTSYKLEAAIGKGEIYMKLEAWSSKKAPRKLQEMRGKRKLFASAQN